MERTETHRFLPHYYQRGARYLNLSITMPKENGQMTYHEVNALHTGLFGGSLWVGGATMLGAYLNYPAAWVAGGSMLLLWLLAATIGDERAR